jgi:hypothetical protein
MPALPPPLPSLPPPTAGGAFFAPQPHAPSGAATFSPAAPTVVYVDRSKGNGMAVSALVLGIIGSVFGLIPILFFLAFLLGLLAYIFGLVGRGKKYGGFRRKMATAGLLLGIVSFGLGIVGVAIVDDAVDDVNKCFDAISQDFRNNTDTSDAACD